MIWAAPVQQLEGSSWGLQNGSFLRKEVGGGGKGRARDHWPKKREDSFCGGQDPFGGGGGQQGLRHAGAASSGDRDGPHGRLPPRW